MIFLELEKEVTELTIEISNSVGQVLTQTTYQNISHIELTASTINSGIYFIKLTDEKWAN